MLTPSLTELTAAAAAVAAAQAGAVLRLRGVLKRRDPVPARWPSVEVMVPCAGPLPRVEETLSRLLGQDYPAQAAFRFIVPSPGDPAAKTLEPLLRRHEGNARLSAGRGPRPSCSGKLADLVSSLEDSPPRAEVLVFADADLLVPPGWLRALVAGLEPSGTVVATASMVYAPETLSPGSLVRMLWTGAGMPWFEALQNVTGQSFALRRTDFDRLGAAELWSRSLTEDLSLAARVRETGGRVRFTGGAVGHSEEPAALGEALGLTNKWMTLYRFYDKRVWALGLLLTAFKAYAWCRGLAALPRPGLLITLYAGDALFLGALFWTLSRELPGRFDALARALRPAWLWAAVCAPLLQAVYTLNLLSSLLTRTVRWGGAVYDLRGPQAVFRRGLG